MGNWNCLCYSNVRPDVGFWAVAARPCVSGRQCANRGAFQWNPTALKVPLEKGGLKGCRICLPTLHVMRFGSSSKEGTGEGGSLIACLLVAWSCYLSQ